MRVAIIHPWFPQYRLEFFRQLIPAAARAGISVDIFHGQPPPEWGDRNDAVETEFAQLLPTRFIKVGSKHVSIKSWSEVDARGPYDLYVLEQAVRNLESYAVLITKPRSVAFWGHGRTYTERATGLQEKLKRWITNRGCWFFAYTSSGARAVIDHGFDPRRVSVVQNSIDSRALRSEIESVTAEELDAFRSRYQLDGPVGLFIGGLDAAKRIPFLIEAAKIAASQCPGLKLLVAGGGSDRHLVTEASEKYPWLEYLGPIFKRDKAVAMAAATALIMPGRVGLVAVDSFAAGKPILTTDWPLHAPEFDYLRHGENAIVASDDESSFAEAMVCALSDNSKLAQLREGCEGSYWQYSVPSMVDNFVGGLREIRDSSGNR